MDEIKKENFDSNFPSITHGEKKNLTEKVRKNPWIVSSIILGAILIVLVVGNVFGLTGNISLTGKSVSGNTAGENLVTYLNTITTSEVKLVDVKEASGLYLVLVEYNGENVPVYITKDGQYYTTTLIPLTADTGTQTDTQTPANIPKTDKPSVELYVFTYCPYGLQMEKAMIPVVKLLGDKINFKIRQIGAMHGEHEKVEAERQLCIEKNYPNKFLDYVLAFAEDTSIGSCSGDATCLASKLSALYTKFGFDASKINSCMTSEGESLYNAEVSNSQSKGVSGSPTLIVNGVDAQVSRSPDAVKTALCTAFNNVPSECSQTLSTSQASAGFGAEASSGSSTASC
jgi:hypothetical protein